MKSNLLVLILLLTKLDLVLAAEMPKVDFFGWLNAEYGRSSSSGQLGGSKGKDRFGIQQSAIGLKASKDKYEGVIVIGGDNLSSGDGNGSNYAIRDAFIVYNDKEEGNFKFSVGAQPILFGLKPSGYPGDRSLRGSVEYGGAGGFNVGFQGLTSAKFDYYISNFEINAVAFDTNESSGANSGSSIDKNTVLQVRFKDLVTDGLYGNIGMERKYLGSKNKSEAIASVGLGYDHNFFDFSVEYISLDKQFTSTTKDEAVWVAELTGKFSKKLLGYIDWAEASEANISTARYGAKYALNDFSSLQIEYGKERRSSTSKPESFDIRWQIKF
jgi:hypothetical protein